MKTCQTCQYRHTEIFTPESKQEQCRRYPPQVVSIGDSTDIYPNTEWPIITLDESCGEHSQSPDGTRL